MKLLALLLWLVSVTSSFGAPAVPEGFGVNIHFTQEQPGELDMIRAAGFTMVRMDLTWQNIETRQHVYDFSSYDNLVDGIEKRGMKIILIVDYTHRLYDNDQSVFSDEGRAAYAAFAAEAAKHFKGKPVIFEIYNEPNITPFWRPTPDADNYAKMALQACKAIRAADANAIIIGPALAGATELDFLETCFKAGLLDYWSAVSVHPYRQTAPETVTEDYRKIRGLIRKYAPRDKSIPIVSGEWGFSDCWASFDRDKQAMYLARQFLTNLANDIPVSIYYDWRDDGLDPKEPEHHFGLVEHTPTGDPKQPFKPKPAYLAAKTLMEQLKGMKFNKQLLTNEDSVQLLLFCSDTEVKVVAWAMTGENIKAPMPLGVGRVQRVTLLGATDTIELHHPATEIVLTENPVFLIPSKPDPLLSTFADWKPLLSPLEMDLVTRHGLIPRITNKSNVRLATRRRFIGPGQSGEIIVSVNANPFEPVFVAKGEVKIDRISFFQQTVAQNNSQIEILSCPVGPKHFLIGCQSKLSARDRVQGCLAFPDRSSPDINLDLGPDRSSQVVMLLPAENTGSTHEMDLALQFSSSPSRMSGSLLRKLKYQVLPTTQPLTIVAEGDESSLASVSVLSATSPEKLFDQQEVVQAVSYQFGEGWKYACVRPSEKPATFDGKPTKLGIWIRGDKSKNLLRMRFIDSTGQMFQPDGGRLNFEGWKYIEFPMDGSSGGFWGGAKDGKIHYPIKLDTLLLIDNASRTANEGKIYFAAPCLYYDVK